MMWLGLIILGVVALVLAGWWWLFRLSLPQTSGTLELPGLAHPVEVLRDVHGVPHLFAASAADVFFAQGFVHVQDRLFQMELNRRVGAGRLSELFGPLALDADRFLRRVGIRRAAEAEAAGLEPEEKAVLEAYAKGVNAGIAALGGRLPLELRLLGVKPEPWTPADSLSWAKVMALNLCTNFEGELFRARLIEKLGPEQAAKFDPGAMPGLPVIVPPGEAAGESAAELERLYRATKEYMPFGGAGASNNWVVSGSRTSTGKPLLANDPHLVLQLPSIWYEAHLVAPGLDVYGVSLPGTPGVVIGHNRKVAWGFTNSMVDVQDLYIEKLHPEQPNRYEFKGEWLEAKRIREVIKVKGKPDELEEVMVTRHGPVLTGGPAGGKGPPLALKWASHEEGHIISALLSMCRAQSAVEFREALRRWHTPSQNVVFADVEGNIGYVMAGVAPIRAKGIGFSPVPGWTGEYEWVDWVPFEELPQSWNPECGYIVTANNRVVSWDYKHHIGLDYMNGYRAARIKHLLTAKRQLTIQDFRDIQMDVHSIPGKSFAAQCKRLAPADPIEKEALEALLAWDGEATPESRGAPVYEAMIVAAVRRALEPTLGPDLVAEVLGKGVANPLAPMSMLLGRYTAFLVGALERREVAILPPALVAEEKDPWEKILAGALSDAVKLLRERMGDEVARWSWGRVHVLALNHPMGSVKPLNLIFNGPRVALGGDADSPLQAAFMPHKAFGAEAWAPSWRQIADLADLKRTVSIHVSGQSGHPGSDHYLDMFPAWHAGESHPQWLDKADIEAHLEGALRLLPR